MIEKHYMELSDALLNSIPLPVLALDGQGVILALNDATRRLLPAGGREPVGIRLDKLFPDWKILLTELRNAKGPFRHEVRLGADRVAEANVTPIPSYGWSITIYDVSEYKDVQARKNHLLGEVTHDLKSPLTAILSFADLVKASGDLTPKQNQFLARIQATATRMSEQVHQLLDVVWIESGSMLTLTDVNLVSLVKSTCEMLEPRAAEKNIKISIDAPDSAPKISADYTRLGQVIANLLNNAIKYSNKGTTVQVKLWTTPDEIALTVKDQGIGVAPEHLDSLFELFYRVKSEQTRSIEGTGLGLYIARSIVEQHGGRITVESTPGAGSTFTMFLPLNTQAES
jgi:two-component system, OmpR family, phosphate regulon sensor histidine kinase PhoR